MAELTRARRDHLVAADELRELLAGDAGGVVVLEVGAHRDDGDPRRDFAAGHVPGARYVQFEDELVGERTGTNGVAPLPDPGELQERLRRLGIDEDTPVVVYGRGRPGPAARGWFVLTWAGLPQARLLDGGLEAWVAAGGALDTNDAPVARRGTVTVEPGALPVLTADEAAAVARRGILLDARASAPYLGGPDQGDRRLAGHIPGAVNAPHAELLTEDGRLLDAEQLAAHFLALGVDERAEVGVYCGGGVSATYEVLALRTLGIPAALYVGSWSEWVTDPDREIERGAPAA